MGNSKLCAGESMSNKLMVTRDTLDSSQHPCNLKFSERKLIFLFFGWMTILIGTYHLTRFCWSQRCFSLLCWNILYSLIPAFLCLDRKLCISAQRAWADWRSVICFQHEVVAPDGFDRCTFLLYPNLFIYSLVCC